MSASKPLTQIKTFPLLLVVALLSLLQGHSLTAQGLESSYTGLLAMAETQDIETPWYALEAFENSYHPQIQASNMEYLKTHPDIIEQIRTDLGERAFQWRLKSLSHRLLYAPESRPGYARLYEAYCKEVIGEVLSELELQSPYTRILTLTTEALPLENTDGFTAYIVNDLALDYRAQYEFSNSTRKTVGMELSGQYATGEVGSYTSELIFDDRGDIYFVHTPYTVWQNNASNPYTALMTPVEETLHILLRKATETAIHAAVKERSNCTPEEAKKIVEEWICVEEAIVGGLVHQILPPILDKKFGVTPDTLVSRDLEIKENISKYRQLGQGIRLVNEMGQKACLELYLRAPGELKALLL